ncbi:MAG: metalloregulator ArsR/SmtB family transcription factor [Gemmatimonadota bacterium]|nr:metalloregulator ArsR/SmtB family transcription factor [Gemmatimonadota bacterium]MDH5804860.1 metalloregulator ArsR/SmtB family transcription factor [Gemmatimonadota bacterium]
MTYKQTLHALSDDTRRTLFERIAREPASVGSLADEFPISQPAVSQHLKVLRDARLVAVQRDGARRVYSIDQEGLEALRTYVDRFWSGVLEAFVDTAASGLKNERKKNE